MASFEIPEAGFEPMRLVALDGAKKGLVGGPAPLSRPSIGGPVVIAVTEGMDEVKSDPDLAAYMRQEAGKFRYYIVTLACTFAAAAGETFEEVWVKIDLRRGDTGDAPIAWSMQPGKLSADIEITKTAKLSPTLKLLGAELGVEAKRTDHLVYLEPRNELQPNPTWYLRKIEGNEIGGSYRFRLVVQTPMTACTGAVDITTNIGRLKWGVIPYRAMPPDGPAKNFALA